MCARIWVMLIVLFGSAPLAAGEHAVVRLWPQGLPDGAKPVDARRIESLKKKNTSDAIFYVGEPSLTLFPVSKDQANGCAVVVCPGGGYNMLAWKKEGVEIAQWLNSLGVFSAVLKYRVPRRDPDQPHFEPLQDAQRAIRMVRHNAKEWGIDPHRVGILGFSAGGHLTVMAGTHWDETTYPHRDDIDKQSCRPDFMVPIYAAYLGDGYNDGVASLGALVRVTKQTPPTFLAVTTDDTFRGAQSALLFVELKKAGVPAELHVYSKGGHGYGIRPADHVAWTWNRRLADWMRVSGWLELK